MLKFNKKLINVTVTEKVLLLNFKNGSNKEFLISNIAKIHLEINKKSKLLSAIYCLTPSFFLFIFLNDYFLIVMVLLLANLSICTVYNFTNHKFKWKLIVKESSPIIHSFGFDYHLKNKIIDSISRIKKSN